MHQGSALSPLLFVIVTEAYYYYYYCYYYNRFMAFLDFVRDYPGEPVPER